MNNEYSLRIKRYIVYTRIVYTRIVYTSITIH